MDIDSLVKQFGGDTVSGDGSKPAVAVTPTTQWTLPDNTAPPTAPATTGTPDVDALVKQFGGATVSNPTTQNTVPPVTIANVQANNRESFVRGIRNVLDTAAHGLGYGTQYIADKLLPQSISQPIDESVANMVASDTALRKQYEATNPNAQGLDINKLAGETLATAPLLPVAGVNKAIQLWKGAVGALPTVAATGAKVAAPFINRLAGAIGEGGIAGGTFGAATSSGNDNSTLSNVAGGAIAGALMGPALETGATLAGNVAPAISKLWANVDIGKLAKNSGIEPNVAKNIVDRLSDAGYTPMQAQAELTKLGPKATLMDLDNSLTTEGSGLASIGGRPTAILKNAMEARSKLANNDVVNIVNKNLGSKPDLDAEADKIVSNAQSAVKGDYNTAYNSGAQLDTTGIVSDINGQLKTAVGGKQSILKTIRGYLFRQGKDVDGEPIIELKDSVPELHEIRMALDDVMEGKEPDTSAGKNTLRAVSNIRNGIDAQLKTVPEMAAADANFAQKIAPKESLQTGYDAISKGMAPDDFQSIWQSSSPESQDAIKKGMTAAIYDKLALAQRGELAGANQLFGSKSANRTNLKLAFGAKGDATLDALQREAAFRTTENAVRSGSQTAERQSVQARYGIRQKGNGLGTLETMGGVITDALTGSPGVATGLSLVKRGGAKALLNKATGLQDRLIEGSADILSQSGSNINKTLNTLSQVSNIQSKVLPRNRYPGNKLLAVFSAPLGQLTYQQVKQLRH